MVILVHERDYGVVFFLGGSRESDGSGKGGGGASRMNE